MAWITVDQKLIGGKLRDFAKRSGISQNASGCGELTMRKRVDGL